VPAIDDHFDHNLHPSSGARIWVETLNTELHLGDPMYAGGGKFGKPNLCGAQTETVRGRPLECFTEQFDPATTLGVHWIRKLGANTASEFSFEVARSWLEQCISSEPPPSKYEHSLNRGTGFGKLPPVEIDHAWTAEQIDPYLTPEALPIRTPARLIDVKPDNGEAGEVRLIETSSHSFQYATLSYCWGNSKGTTWVTTRDNLPKQLLGIKRDDLPATIRESLTIVENLGLRYIWIDALCILQRDPTDWAKEAEKMAGMYRGSILTIAASFSPSSDKGCFNSKSSSHFEKFKNLVCIEASLSDGQRSRLYICDSFRPSPYSEEVLGGPLSSRAWTYQEQVLSRRTLHYAASQLVWACEHCLITEDNFLGLGRDRLYPIMNI
jgi:Heterokaryon incompatibility protein (HET)